MSEDLVVIAPKVRPPFDAVFNEIIRGIQRETPGTVDILTIDESTTSADINEQLNKKSGRRAIGLGNKAKTLLEPLDRQHAFIYGATFLNPDQEPENTQGISLTPSPAAIFPWLATLQPNIHTVHVVYQQDYNGWIVELAKIAAPEFNLTIVAHAVTNVREAANLYRDILNTTDPSSHALWLMQRDPTLDEKAVVPNILAQAWSKSFVIFSSNPAHVSRGALFALYPDNEKMGSSLAKAALENVGIGIIPLGDLQIAVNVRTASHVGKTITRQEEQRFDLIFPNR